MQVITNDCEEVFRVPCYRCGTNQQHPQVKMVECRDKQRCDEARERVSDNVTCVDPGGNQSIAPGRKRPAEVIQVQPQKPQQGNDSGAPGKLKLQAYQTKVADATNMDLDGISDQVQNPSAETETIGLGAEVETGGAQENGGKTQVAANKQQRHRDAYRGKQPPRQMQGPKKQKLLTECLKTSTTSHPSVEKQASADHELLGKPMLGKQQARAERAAQRGSAISWVSNKTVAALSLQERKQLTGVPNALTRWWRVNRPYNA